MHCFAIIIKKNKKTTKAGPHEHYILCQRTMDYKPMLRAARLNPEPAQNGMRAIAIYRVVSHWLAIGPGSP